MPAYHFNYWTLEMKHNQVIAKHILQDLKLNDLCQPQTAPFLAEHATSVGKDSEGKMKVVLLGPKLLKKYLRDVWGFGLKGLRLLGVGDQWDKVWVEGVVRWGFACRDQGGLGWVAAGIMGFHSFTCTHKTKEIHPPLANTTTKTLPCSAKDDSSASGLACWNSSFFRVYGLGFRGLVLRVELQD